MEHHIGIDVSLELSSLCVLDATGKVIREAKVASEPEALARKLATVLHRIWADGTEFVWGKDPDTVAATAAVSAAA